MKKSLLSIMAASGLIASSAALADTSLVEVYGMLNVDFQNVSATGSAALGTTVPGCALGTCQMVNGAAGSATTGQPSGLVAPSRNRVTSNSSNIGFRGKEDLGMGLNAIFQVESGISMDSASTTTTTAGTASTGFFGSRNTNVGLSSTKLGTIFYGNWDTPYKVTSANYIDPFWGTTIASVNTVVGTPGFGVQSITTSGRNVNSSDASFDRRQGNAVQYWSPNFSGLSFRLAYSANEGRTIEPAAVAATTTNSSPTIYSASLRYEYGPFAAAYAFEQHRDYFGLTQLGGAAIGSAALGANPTSRDNGNKVTLSYKFFGTTTANVAWERLAYNNSETTAGAATDLIHYHRDLIYFSLLHQIGAGTIRVGFGDARQGSCDRVGGAATNPCSTTGLDARHYAVGYSYSFSKRTDVFGFWTRVNNGQFANYEIGNNAAITANITGIVGPGVGAHQQGFALGIRHVF